MIPILPTAALVVVSVATLLPASTLLGDGRQNHSDSSVVVGTVVFPISCSNQAQEDVEHGMAMMHSFLFGDAESQFKAAAGADPTCAMAYWAQASFLRTVPVDLGGQPESGQRFRKGNCDSQPDICGTSRSSGNCALHNSRGRYAWISRPRSRCGAALCADCSGGATRVAHAIAYFRQAWTLARGY